MKLKRMVAVALSIATVAGAGVMAAVPASAYSWKVVESPKGTYYRGAKCGGTIGKSTSNYQYDRVSLKKMDQTTIRYVANDNMTKWAVNGGSYSNGWGQKGVYCDILRDSKASESNHWSPGSKQLKVNVNLVDSNGNHKVSKTIMNVAGAEAKMNMWVDWYYWFGPDLRSGGFNAYYTDPGFRVQGFIN